MTTQEIINLVITGVILPLLTTLVGYLISYIKTKYKDTKLVAYMTKATQIIHASVRETYQVYVQYLKDHDLFDEAKQLIALQMTVDKINTLLPMDIKNALRKFYPEYKKWIVTQIESYINELKTEGVVYINDTVTEIVDETCE